MLTIGSLFSGIGGLELGLERAGLGPVKWQVEIDDYCNKILEKHWPEAKRYRDIYEIRELEPVDLICGGFPCQPVSCAGSRKAQADDRWLWPEFVRIIRMVKPRWVVAENVPGLLTANDNQAMGEVLRDLALCGYDIEWDCISAASVGAVHRRDRIFIIAHAESNIRCSPRNAGQVASDRSNTSLANTKGTKRKGGSGSWARRPGPTDGGNDADYDTGRRERTKVSVLSRPTRSSNQMPMRNSQWAIEPDVGRVANGVPSRVDRLKCLGNAVVPQVAEVIGLLIMEHERVMAEGA